MRKLFTLQRTFPNFPDGWPGLGLLLLRATAGAGLAVCGYACLVYQDPGFSTIAVATLPVAIGLFLLVGYLTSFASVVAVLISSSVALARFPAANIDFIAIRVNCIFTAITAVALACLGPGAFSLDARRYGRHEIIIPKRSDSSLEE